MKAHVLCWGRWLWQTERGRSILLAISGILTGLCVSFDALGALEWVAPVPALAVFFSRVADPAIPLRKLYRDGFVFNYAFSVVVFHWFVYMYPLDFVTDYRAVALCIVLVAVLGLSLLQTLFGALVPVLLAMMARGRLLRRFPILQTVTVAALWCVREWIWTLTWSGVPWGRLALGQTALPIMIASARWFGSYFITFVIVLVNAAIAYALLHKSMRRLCALIGTGAFALQLICGSIILTVQSRNEPEATVTVAAIQGNIGSADKWNVGWRECYDIYYDLSEQAAAAGADLIVWPETAVPVELERYPDKMHDLCKLAREYETVLLLGVFADGEAGESYNAIRAIDADGNMMETIYVKRHLVPFGEYVPLRALIEILCPPLLEISQLASEVTPGTDAAIFDTVAGKIGSMICFDSIYEALAIDSVRSGAQLLAISTNDSWFFDSTAVYMHNAQAKLRAVETGRSVVRAANTGVSSLIDSQGRENARLDALETGIVQGEIALYNDMTLYTRTGNVFVWLCIGVLLALLGACGYEGIRQKRAQTTAEKEK